jgi:predicted peroxiredoxin
MIKRSTLTWVVTGLAVLAVAVSLGYGAGSSVLGAEKEGKTILINMTSGVDDPHSVAMGLSLANHALDAGHEVVLFFNVRGASVPTSKLPGDFSFNGDNIGEQLKGLIEKGADVQVCKMCLGVMGASEGDVMEGASIASADSLFGALDANTAVFTY